MVCDQNYDYTCFKSKINYTFAPIKSGNKINNSNSY